LRTARPPGEHPPPSMANDRTEKATPKRREEARKRGQVARSQEVNVAIGLLAAFGLLAVVGGTTLTSMRELMAGTLATAGDPPPITVPEAWSRLTGAMFDAARMLAPYLAVGAVAGILASAIQVRPRITPERLKPRFQVLNPVTGIKKLFSPRSAVGLVKDLLKVALVGVLTYLLVKDAMPSIEGLTGAEPGQILAFVGGFVLKLGFAVAGLYLVIALGDVLFERFQHERDIRMTKDEVKREAKDQDINPHVRGAIKARQREMAMRRMMAAVPDADVVITNPTHYAVALRYARDLPAPRVIAKGMDNVAFRIIAVAREHGVTVLQDPPLARSLHAAVEVGDFIPAESFAAVAEILAYVYRVTGREPAAA
ncbi:MAG: flagellar biosynthesis protein FlhB, partial [Actinomycetota bacterium]